MNTGEHRDSAAAPLVADSAPSVHLAVQNGTQKGTRIRCRHVVTLVGSREHCKVRLPHDRVAPVHLAIINDGKKVTAVDLLSEWGTRLNNQKLEQQALNSGDRVEVGPWDFIVEIAQPPRNGHAEVVDLEPTPQCVALEHIESGRVLQPNRGACLIGRRNGCDIVLSDPDVSRAHALLITYCDHPAIIDLASKFGTKVNGELVSFRVLKDEDMLQIGESQFRVRVVGAPSVDKAAKSGSGAKSGSAAKSGSGKKSAPAAGANGRAVAANGRVNGAATPAAASADDLAAEALAAGDLSDGSSIAAALESEEPEPDLINIAAVEGAQRWRIAEDAEKVTRLEKAGRQ